MKSMLFFLLACLALPTVPAWANNPLERNRSLRRELAARGVAPGERAAKAAELLGAEIDDYRAGGAHAGEFPERWLPAGLAIVEGVLSLVDYHTN